MLSQVFYKKLLADILVRLTRLEKLDSLVIILVFEPLYDAREFFFLLSYCFYFKYIESIITYS